MVRSKSQSSDNGKSPSKKSRKCESSETSSENDINSSVETPTTTTTQTRSVHKQNLYIVSFPVILLFNILRSVLYQLFVIFRYIYNATARVLYRPVTQDYNLEIVNTDCCQSGALNVNKDDEQILIVGGEMSVSRNGSGPGPGDPLFAKQKHHHRRAFEYISKALKIDEENEGKFTNLLFDFFYLHIRCPILYQIT